MLGLIKIFLNGYYFSLFGYSPNFNFPLNFENLIKNPAKIKKTNQNIPQNNSNKIRSNSIPRFDINN